MHSGYKFCFKCNLESHAPASCQEFKDWSDKFESDPFTKAYMNAFCKKCPEKKDLEDWKERIGAAGLTVAGKFGQGGNGKQFGCGSTIFKDGGCNHMYLCPCKFDWCWACSGPWYVNVKDKNGKTSPYHTSGWYNCNNVDQKADVRKSLPPGTLRFFQVSMRVLRF